MIKSKILYLFFVIVLLADFSYSFMQYYHTPLEGDMAGGIVPAKHVQEIFDDPFGFNTIANNTSNANPNRYFAHLFFRDYFRTTPFLFQKITSPIESIYLSTATAKLLIHFLIIYVLAALITQTKNFFNSKLLLVAILLTPMFQAYGYKGSLGIIDSSITYTFFYALPILLLLIYFSYFYKLINQEKTKKLSVFSKIILISLTIVLPFSGALISPVIIIIAALLLIYYIKKYYPRNDVSSFLDKVKNTIKQIPKTILFFFVPLTVLSLYSLYLGRYNSTFENELMPLTERYLRIPIGLYSFLTQMLGYPLLLILIGINSYIIKKHFWNENGVKIITSLKWIGIFALLYILLLPLGGYKTCRPNIIRFDTMIPITIGLIYFYAKSTYFLLQNLTNNKKIYSFCIAAFFIIISAADISNLNEADCEKQALHTIAKSKLKIVPLKDDCTVVSWGIITQHKATELNSKLLKFWNITSEEKLYYQSSNK